MPTPPRPLTARSLRHAGRALTTAVPGQRVAEVLSVSALITAVASNDNGPRPDTPWVVALLLVLGALALTVGSGVQILRLTPYPRRTRPTGTYIFTRIMVVTTLAALVFNPSTDGLGWVAALILSLLVLIEASAVTIAVAAVPMASNLPGVKIRNEPPFRTQLIYFIHTAAIVVFALLNFLHVPGWLLIVVVLVAAVPTVVALAESAMRVLARQRAERGLNRELEKYGASFLLYWDAPAGSAYQLGMWLPYLKRLERRFLIVLRNPATFREISTLTDVPVLVRRRVSELDALITPSLKAVFYVNTATKNANMVHYTGLQHIQLNHGDSDKAPSYRRVFRMYDKNFVAGQAAVDRFASHGVIVPRDAFEIVGRPQVESVMVQQRPIASVAAKTVLYASTWFGYLEDSRYCSLPNAVPMVRALIERDCRVIFRPHPWARKTPALARQVQRVIELLAEDAQKSGRTHLFGPAAERDLGIIDCFNAADAMVADISSVVPDFLYSEKPFTVCDMKAHGHDDLLKEFPLAAAAYVLDADLGNMAETLDAMLNTDPLAARRRELKNYYLGDFPAESYADAFVSTARRYV